MKIGISVTSSFPNPLTTRHGAQQMIKRTRAAHAAGLDSLFVGDHHIVPTPYYQNTPILGRLLAEWQGKPAGALFLLPLWNPVLVAEQTATLANIHDGRFILQCGLGRDERQFKAMGAKIKYRPSAFEQSIEVLRALWQGESVSLDGRWSFEEAKISPLPPENIDIWIGASAAPAIDRAARLGDAWLADPSLSLSEASVSMESYLTALQRHNKPVPDTIAIRRDIYVAEDEAEADNLKSTLITKGYRGFNVQSLLIGNAQQIAEQMLDYNRLGYTDIIIRNLHTDPEKAIASTIRLADVKNILL